MADSRAGRGRYENRNSLVGARQVILEEIQRRYNAPAWWVRKAIGMPTVICKDFCIMW